MSSKKDFTTPNTSQILSSTKFLYSLLVVAFSYIVIRAGTAFIFAALFGRTWHIELQSGIIPIVAFSTDADTYTRINTYSTVATAACLAIIAWILLYKLQKHHTEDRIASDEEHQALWHRCLLYTSPSPRDATLSRMPSSA